MYVKAQRYRERYTGRISARGVVAIPRMRSTTAQFRSFVYVGFSAWNFLPHALRLE